MERRTTRSSANHADNDRTVTAENGGGDVVQEQPGEVEPSKPIKTSILANHKFSDENSAVTAQVVTASAVNATIIPTQSLSEDDEECIGGDNSFDDSSLCTGSLSSKEGIENLHSEKLQSYLVRKVAKDKNNFGIDNISKEEEQILHCELDVGCGELEDLHSSYIISKKIQKKFKEEEEA
eukprot:12915918-Ditylum_brightwellii.AAC.1